MTPPGTRRILCGEAARGSRPANNTLCLRNVGPHRNVRLQIEDISRTLVSNIPQQLVDLLEIATFVYVADQYFTRGGCGVEDMGANWRRSLHFEIPVRCQDFWRQADITGALCDTLGFLSEDEYSFTFCKYKKPPALDGYLNLAKRDYAVRPSEVILFSGGLDSLGGAVEHVVVEGQPVALVHHEATSKMISRLRMLRQMLDERSRGPKPLHVTVRINKSERFNNEYTQRTRSFLYACLATVIAQMCELNVIRFFENGTVSLNLPIAREVVGAKATRTTHPRVLAGFSKLFSLLTGRSFAVENDFLWKTKDEVVRGIIAADCAGLIDWSTSCAHTWEQTLAKPHCGRCSQCIDRRFAVLAADAGGFDRADSYDIDLLTGAREEGEPRRMLASYVEVAQQVAEMSEMDFFMRFGEVARVVRQLGESADKNARKIYELHRRHANSVLRVIDKGVAHHASLIRARALPQGSLLRMVHDLSVPSQVAQSAVPKASAKISADEANVFRRCGEGWQLRFDGHEVLWFKGVIGFRYLYELLQFPGKRFTLSELLVALHGTQSRIVLGDGEAVLDHEARLAYSRRLEELSEEIEEARKNNDIGNLEKHELERAQILAETRKAWFKRSAKRSNSDLNRVRNSVGNAIRRTFRTIAKFESAGAEHFKSSTSLGFTLIYSPTERIPWSF